MLFKLSLLLLTIAITTYAIVHDFPALEQWINQLDTRGDVENFLHTGAAFAREVVTVYEEEGQQKQPCLGTKKYPLIQGLERLKKSRKDHQVMLVFNTPADYKESVKSLTLMQHDWIWLYFPIEQGPHDGQTPISINEFSAAELELMKHYQLAFGFTTDLDFGKGEFLRHKMEALANKTDEWYTRLHYKSDFIVELSMHVLLNTSDHARVLRPFLDRTMYLSMVATNRYSKLILRHKGELKALAKMIGKERLYLNIPENLRVILSPVSWFGNSTSLAAERMGSGNSLFVFLLLTHLVCLIVWLTNKIVA